MDDKFLALYPALATQDVPLSGAASYYGSIKFRGDAVTGRLRLLTLIREGKLTATGIAADGVRRIIPVDDIINAPPASTRSWSRSELILDRDGGYGDAIRRGSGYVWKNICVDRDALLTLGGLHAEKSQQTAHEPGSLSVVALPSSEDKVDREISYQERQSLAGRASAKARRANRPWVPHAKKLAAEIFERLGEVSKSRFATEIDATWKLEDVPHPEHRALEKLVQELADEGVIRCKLRTRTG